MKTIPPQLAPFIEQRKITGRNTRELADFVLNAVNEPITALEATNLMAQLAERKYDYKYVSKILKELVANGRAVARVETDTERSTRANGRLTKGYNGMLYIGTADGSKYVPARTTAVLVPGVELGNSSSSSIKYNYTYEKKTKRKYKKRAVNPAGLPSKSKSLTGDINELVEQLIEARTSKLQSKLDRIAAILAE
jgi:hypothetical protein